MTCHSRKRTNPPSQICKPSFKWLSYVVDAYFSEPETEVEAILARLKKSNDLLWAQIFGSGPPPDPEPEPQHETRPKLHLNTGLQTEAQFESAGEAKQGSSYSSKTTDRKVFLR